MSNIIKIKHGNSPPTTDNLENYELGYANKGLYIKDNNQIIQLTAPFPIPIQYGGTGAVDPTTARKNLQITPNNINAVASFGVNGEDDGHKMAMSWNGSKVIVGIDNNATVKTLVDESHSLLSDTGWVFAYGSTNWVSDGTKPFLTAVRKIGNTVNFIIDFTARIQISSGTEASAKLVMYRIPAACKPSYMWYKSINSQQGKHLTLKITEEGADGICLRFFGETIDQGDRIAETITYMV